MNPEAGPSPFEEAREETETEIERLNEELNSIPKEERAKRVQKISNHLESLGINIANMDQRDLVTRFVTEEAKGLLNSN
ncbi:MAG: hypothetical protein M1324_02295 [Patescibacteria group bacterium]|nr:hypothetical protein [Patescibacteria group bacterium]